MSEPKQKNPVCKNIFKTEDPAALKRQYTQKWIELINRLEKNKENRKNH